MVRIVTKVGMFPNLIFRKKNDFKKHLFVNNRVVNILIDMDAKGSVCGMTRAKPWVILDKVKPSTAKVHPYNLIPINIRGTALCSVPFKNRTVRWNFTFCQNHVNEY